MNLGKIYYFPEEIWRKIWLYTVVVDEKMEQLLKNIRKINIINSIEKRYRDDLRVEYVYSWLHNDICRWLNDNYATMWVIRPMLKEYFNRNFEVVVKNNDDLNEIEIKLFNECFEEIRINELQGIRLDDSILSYRLWNIHLFYLTEKELKSFNSWTKKIYQI